MDVAKILNKYPKKREYILDILHEVQNNDPNQYLSNDSLKKVAVHLNIPLAQVYGIVGYYSMFSTKPRGKYLIRVCKSPVCSLMGGEKVFDSVKATLDRYFPDKSAQLNFTIEETECLGQCSESPCLMINQTIYGNLTPEKIDSIILELKASL